MAQIRADEITRVLRDEIENYDSAVSVTETGFVISVGDGIARIHGLETVMAGELIEFSHGVSGIALNLEEDQVGAVLLGDYTDLKEGDEVRQGKARGVSGEHHARGGQGAALGRGAREDEQIRRGGLQDVGSRAARQLTVSDSRFSSSAIWTPRSNATQLITLLKT